MIASFCYEQEPPENCVAVRMLWSAEGLRVGMLDLPGYLRDRVRNEDLPETELALSFDGALAYGLVLSIRSGLSLRLSGDQSVWPDEWGQMIYPH